MCVIPRQMRLYVIIVFYELAFELAIGGAGLVVSIVVYMHTW